MDTEVKKKRKQEKKPTIKKPTSNNDNGKVDSVYMIYSHNIMAKQARHSY